MGNYLQAGYRRKTQPDVTPSPSQLSNWDPNYGFVTPREPKVMKATEEELYSAKIDLQDRDYCAHLLLEYRRCYKESFPFIGFYCEHPKHNYLNCQYSEFVDRMKDYEREKRLMERQKRKAAAA